MVLPLLVAERPQGDIEKPFQLHSEFRPAGDQPQAIDELCEGLERGERDQVLLGVTGSGKTFTMAHVIARTGRPAIILAPNKTLAAQLYGEMRSFFPENAVEYFVSYYDYYQPEAYVPRTDTYVEKESSLNEQIDRMRHSATRAILERRDVVVVASVSCIYGIGTVENYSQMTLSLAKGDRINRTQLLARFVELQYRRNDHNFFRGSFRVRGDTIELFPAHYEDRAWRLSLFGDEIEAIHEIDRPTGLVDPPCLIRPVDNQVDDLMAECRDEALRGHRVMVTTLTKKMAEALTEYLHEAGLRVRYMHSDVDTIERIEIIRDLRLGVFDVLIGINLLRE